MNLKHPDQHKDGLGIREHLVINHLLHKHHEQLEKTHLQTRQYQYCLCVLLVDHQRAINTEENAVQMPLFQYLPQIKHLLANETIRLFWIYQLH